MEIEVGLCVHMCKLAELAGHLNHLTQSVQVCLRESISAEHHLNS